jgi:hypothetical protein
MSDVLYQARPTPTQLASNTHRRQMLANIEAKAAARVVKYEPPPPVSVPVRKPAFRWINTAAVCDCDYCRGAAARPIRPKVETIQRFVCEHYRIALTEILSQRRTAEVVRARQVSMYLAKQLTLRSLPEIGRLFAGKDHTTVLHAVRKIAELRKIDLDLDEVLTSLTARLSPASTP